MTMNFNSPAVTDAYGTAFVPNLLANQAALGSFLDPAFAGTITNQPNGTKRWNSATGLFEQWSTSGAAWSAVTTGYAQKTGDTFSGLVTLNNSIALQLKDSAGTARRSVLMSASNTLYFGDVDNALGGVAIFTAGATLQLQVAGSIIAQASAGAFVIDASVTINPSSTEGIRIPNSAAYISGFNTANSTRTGYLQFNTGADVILAAEGGAVLHFSVGGTVRFTLDGNGQAGLGVTPTSAWSSAFKTIQLPGGSVYSNSATMLIGTNVYYDGTNNRYVAAGAATTYQQSSGTHFWFNSVTGATGAVMTQTQAMTLDTNGNLGVGSNPSPWWGGRRGVQLGSLGGLGDASIVCSPGTANYMQLGSNTYTDSSIVTRAVQTGTATIYTQGGGTHSWSSAAAVAAGAAQTFPGMMSLGPLGILSIGPTAGTVAVVPLYISGSGGETSMNIDESSASGYQSYRLGSGTGIPSSNGAALHFMNSSYATGGAYAASRAVLTSFGAGGLALSVDNASGGVTVFTDNGVLRYQVTSLGWHMFLTSTSSAVSDTSWGTGAYTTYGPNAASGTGAAFGIGYNTGLDQSELISLAPSSAWKPMAFYASAHKFFVNGLGVSLTVNTSGATFSSAAQTTPVAMTMAATSMSADMRTSNVFTGTLTGNIPAANIALTNFTDGQTVNIFLTQDGTGSRTITWPTSFKWSRGVVGVLTTTANAVDILILTYRAATGFFYASLAPAFS